MDIEININELVLNGIYPENQEKIVMALQYELKKFYGNGDIPFSFMQDNNLHFVDGGEISFLPNISADSIGVQIAQSINRGLNR